jgi:L-lactate dehydrogenase complex protein LldG
MTSARDDIFANIRRSLGVAGDEATRRMAVRERLERAPKGVIPARGQIRGAERVAMFRAQAEGVHATVAEIASAADIPAAIAFYLRERNLPATLRMGDDSLLRALPWDKTALAVSHGASGGGDVNAVSRAIGAVAETGTLALTSGPDSPTTLNFLPDNHIVVVAAADIAGDMEEIWARLRFAYGKGELPRVVNFVTGPSRSADIGQTMLLGAHGPRSLHILVVAG